MNFPNLSGRLGGVMLGLLLVTGCVTTRYEYMAPHTEQGRYCATQCASIKEACQSNEISRAQAEQYNCQQRSEYRYHDCLHHARSEDEAKRCFRPACWNNPNTWRCDENYRQCFVGCGGTVRTIKEE
ncbi:hypothetical protein [Dechloromonas sp. HYN0024]|uniref:hypothetical protein n=1 Tax=Dechloromonas sp. HYN0024 TaxID=2231055 RepID=UPI000E43742E|nr:hypothetical protein [Dechloromonas sp. HYN0024]AXS79451.1 hypothetical protein HYN24_05075 [Dechloromonas sp. HYN0024]